MGQHLLQPFFKGLKMGRIILLISTFVLSSVVAPIGPFFLLASEASSTNKGNYAKLASIVRKLKDHAPINETIDSRLVYYRPEEILKDVEKFEEILRNLPADEQHLRMHNVVGDLYYSAIIALLKGATPHPTDAQRAGWFIGSSDSINGHREILEIIARNKLDSTRTQKLIDELMALLNYPEAKQSYFLSAGFKELSAQPDLLENYLAPLLLSEYIAQLKISKIHATYRSTGPTQSQSLTLLTKPLLPKIFELANEFINKNPSYKSSVESKLNHLLQEGNTFFYDESVQHMNENGIFPSGYGMEETFLKLAMNFNRPNKSHVLLTSEHPIDNHFFQLLSDFFVSGRLTLKDNKLPIMFNLELSPIIDPSNVARLANIVQISKMLSQIFDRHFVIVLNDAHLIPKLAMELMLNNLEAASTSKGSKVHVIFSTTSENSRKLLSNSKLIENVNKVTLPNLTDDNAVQYIKDHYLPFWRGEFKGLKNIEDRALKMAIKQARTESNQSANYRGAYTLIEGALSLLHLEQQSKLATYSLTSDHIARYLRDYHNQSYIAGDSKLSEEFEKSFAKFNRTYLGQEGIKIQIKEILFHHFKHLTDLNQMTSFLLPGPPGGGKSFFSQVLADTFFNGALLTINAAEFDGPMGKTKLLGSTAGFIGSEDQHSILAKFFAKYPNGGVIKVEEADYLSSDVIQLFTNMITDKKIMDGLGHEWDTSKYVLIMNTNIGQEYLLPVNAKNKMNWEQYAVKRAQMTRKVTHQGVEIEEVKDSVKHDVLEKFVRALLRKNNPQVTDDLVSQEAEKQKSRYNVLYVLSPTKDEMRNLAFKKVSQFVKKAADDFDVEFNIPVKVIDSILDIENVDFSKGLRYVNQRIDYQLLTMLESFLHLKGKTVDVDIQEKQITFQNKKLPELNLILSTDGVKTALPFKVVAPEEENQWANNQSMQKRIDGFARSMHSYLKGNEKQIQDTKELLKLKTVDWSVRPVITQLGTTGNGKTEFFKSMAKSLYDDKTAMFSLENIRSPHDLELKLNSPEFLNWLKSRLTSGGGIILFDELLSFHGQNPLLFTDKIAAIKLLYTLLDEGFLKIGQTTYDLRGFVIGITGNALQEFFGSVTDTPEAEKLTKFILKEATKDKMLEALKKYGIDAPMAARFGKMYLNGPLNKKTSTEIFDKKLAEMVSVIEKQTGKKINFMLDDEFKRVILERNTSITEGMRGVNEVMDILLRAPLAGMSFDGVLKDGENKIEVKLNAKEEPVWSINGKRVILSGERINDNGNDQSLYEKKWTYLADSKNKKDFAPKLNDLNKVEIEKRSKEALAVTAIHEVYGHFMVSSMLHRENPTQAISLLPGKGYLGYVRPKFDSPELVTLTDALKRMIVLEAGHRSVFLENIKAFGGGTGGSRDPKETPRDDLGRIEAMMRSMLSSSLVGDVHEFSNPVEIMRAKEIMRLFTKNMADYLIIKGKESKQFDAIYNRVLDEKFVGEEYLDRAVKKVNWNVFGDPHRLFEEAFVDSLNKAQVSVTDGLGKNILNSLAKDVMAELKVWSQSPKEVVIPKSAMVKKPHATVKDAPQSKGETKPLSCAQQLNLFL